MSGEELRKKLVLMGIEQQKIAEKMGYSKQNFSATLKTQNVKSGFIEELCKALGMSIADFYGEVSSTPKTEDPTLSEALKTIFSQQQTIKTLSELLAKGGDTAPTSGAPLSAAK